MLNQLQHKLYNHLAAYHPDLLLSLNQERKVTAYLRSKADAVSSLLQSLKGEKIPEYIIEERCLQEMTADLWPSRYQYISEILEADFFSTSELWRESGLRTYEIIHLKQACKPVFESFGFNADSEDDRALRYAVIATIQDYLEK